MRRTLQQTFPGSFFHNLPQIHDHDARAHETHHRKIMGNKQIGGTEALLSIPQQIKNLRLHRGIQSGYGLVADDQIGAGDKSARHGDTLPLPAGKLVRIAPLHTCKANGGENLGHGTPTGFRRQFPLRAVPACQRRKRFFHGLPDAHPGVQRGKGVLKDHLHAPCQWAFCPCRGQGPALKQNFARAGRQQAAGKTPQRGLAAAGFAHQPETFPGMKLKINAVHGAQPRGIAPEAAADPEKTRNLPQDKQRRVLVAGS